VHFLCLLRLGRKPLLFLPIFGYFISSVMMFFNYAFIRYYKFHSHLF